MEAKFQAARDYYPDSVEVKRGAGQKTTDKYGLDHPYTATKILCKGCYKNEDSYCKDAKQSKIKCWNLVCYCCGLYGHSKDKCEVPTDMREKAGLTYNYKKQHSKRINKSDSKVRSSATYPWSNSSNAMW
jgi:hypothetical protein